MNLQCLEIIKNKKGLSQLKWTAPFFISDSLSSIQQVDGFARLKEA